MTPTFEPVVKQELQRIPNSRVSLGTEELLILNHAAQEGRRREASSHPIPLEVDMRQSSKAPWINPAVGKAAGHESEAKATMKGAKERCVPSIQSVLLPPYDISPSLVCSRFC